MGICMSRLFGPLCAADALPVPPFLEALERVLDGDLRSSFIPICRG